jgi:hypothetical protein
VLRTIVFIKWVKGRYSGILVTADEGDGFSRIVDVVERIVGEVVERIIGSDFVIRERKFRLFFNVSERGRDVLVILFPLTATNTLFTLHLGIVDGNGNGKESTTLRHVA